MTEFEESFDEKTVLITGGAGAIGSNLTAEVAKLPTEEVIVLDDFSSGYRWLLSHKDKITVVSGSVLDEEKLRYVFKKGVDVVFHLAAHFANKNSVEHPQRDLKVNGLGTLKVLEYANLVDVDRFVYASSGCGVYGHDSTLPYSEKDYSLQLDTPYQVTKLLGELYSNYFHNIYNMPIVNARFFNSFGPGEVPGKYRNVIPNFFYWAEQGQELPITGSGTETRDWTYVDDIVQGLMQMAIKPQAVGESFNLATGHETRVIDMAQMVNSRVGNEGGITYVARREWDKKTRIVGSIDKAQRVLDYQPKVSFEEGLDRYQSWFEANFEQIEEDAEF
jgi:nucleoside-diphosphate-sugar epimerase